MFRNTQLSQAIAEEILSGSPSPAPDDELAGAPDDEHTDGPDDEHTEGPDDELAGAPDDEHTEGPDDELATPESLGISNLAELAEALEVDPAFLYGLKVPLGDGNGDPITLGELKDVYQTAQQASRTRDTLGADHQAFLAAAKDYEQRFSQSLSMMDGMISNMAGQLMSDFQGIDWKRLEEEDPAEYSAKQTNLMRRQQEIAGMQQMAAQAVQQHNQQMDRARQQMLAENYQRLIGATPEWAENPKNAAAEMRDIQQMMMSDYGFSPHEVSLVSDYRVGMLLRDLQRLKKAHGSVGPVKEKLRKLPPLRRPGAKATAPSKKGALDSKIRQAKQTGSKEDILAAQRGLLQQAGVLNF